MFVTELLKLNIVLPGVVQQLFHCHPFSPFVVVIVVAFVCNTCRNCRVRRSSQDGGRKAPVR